MTDSLGGPSNISATGKGVRTKLGCFTCRARKVKCDLTRPSCQTCTRLNLDCTYVKPEGQLNIPRLRRGRKRRRSDPVEHQSSGSTTSWADRFGEEINGSGSGSGHSEIQQLRRASTNTMPELWRYQYENNLFPSGSGSGSGSGEELASSAYLNSLMRRESMPVSMRAHAQGRGLGEILDPAMRTASPMGYSSFHPSTTQLDQLRRSMTPSALPTGHWQPAPSMTPELNQYNPNGALPPVLPPISHDSSPLNWHTPQMLPLSTPSFDSLQTYPPSGDLHTQQLPYLPNQNWSAHPPSTMPELTNSHRPVSPYTSHSTQTIPHSAYPTSATATPIPNGPMGNPNATPQQSGRDDGLPPWLSYQLRQ